ncbi:hypothetical protein SCP_0705510 [Sparassis crispa]|uniref:Uncharacterized protein n=1 Tax=Sparassis crispa TaxID=139825 RepID=A0A401GUF7_9APHY|nr:hypothetical protein SCP_0705510 [Sparassis crispa]GBE85364.1 hypothetical protein SCP_0705510 [Sparassis crispa]
MTHTHQQSARLAAARQEKQALAGHEDIDTALQGPTNFSRVGRYARESTLMAQEGPALNEGNQTAPSVMLTKLAPMYVNIAAHPPLAALIPSQAPMTTQLLQQSMALQPVDAKHARLLQ